MCVCIYIYVLYTSKDRPEHVFQTRLCQAEITFCDRTSIFAVLEGVEPELSITSRVGT